VSIVLWPPFRALFIACAAASVCATASLAQDINYASVNAAPGKSVQLSYHASAHKNNCAPAALPTVRVVEPPKSGVLTVRDGVLTTDKIEGCPELKIPARVVLYMANPGYAGPDHVKYEVTNEEGKVAAYDMTITVETAPPAQNPPAQNPPAGTTEGKPL
jgi:hypothetical protein